MIGRIQGCRSCGAEELLPVLDLGQTPLANRLLTANQLDQDEPTFPLELVFCAECTLVQITETVSPEVLFGDYVYFSSFSDTMVAHAKQLATTLIPSLNLGPNSLVVEAASNDGYLLQHYQARGIPVLGVEPAANVAQVAVEKRGIRTEVAFFGESTAKRLVDKGFRADLFHAHNVLAHVADLNDFVRGIRTILTDTGVAVIEVPYLRNLIDHCEFDTIYHEHLCYFSLTALDSLFRRNGLYIRHTEVVDIHGGSLRVTIGRMQQSETANEVVTKHLGLEQHAGLLRYDYYKQFGFEVARLKRTLIGLLNDLKASGKSIAAYGASAKGSTLLNFFGIGRDLLDFVVDRSTVKQGNFTPGTRLPILAPEALSQRKPSYVLLLTWNFADEILKQQSQFRETGGRFIIPIPDVRIV